jgi:hypothetical protein
VKKQRAADRYQAGNQTAAEIIAADPVRYAGIMQEWARMVLNPPAERTAPASRRAA